MPATELVTDHFKPSDPLQTAVLFLVFNRPGTTKQVFEAIRTIKPPRLYVAADGPRVNCEGETDRVARVRQIATAVDWSCELKTLFRVENLGCKNAVSSAVTWFFEQEEQGIVLEDDCLPHPSFFSFCEVLLKHYYDDERVSVITGNNFQAGQWRGDGSYYFSRYSHVWGWASWRRAWAYYDGELKFWPKWKVSNDWVRTVPDKVERKYRERIFDHVYTRQIDTWDYPWTASLWYQGGLTATPNVNLVSNIGFDADATHTRSSDSSLANMPTGAIGALIHPNAVKQDLVADRYVFNHVFGGRDRRFPWLLLNLPRHAVFIYRKIKNIFAK